MCLNYKGTTTFFLTLGISNTIKVQKTKKSPKPPETCCYCLWDFEGLLTLTAEVSVQHLKQNPAVRLAQYLNSTLQCEGPCVLMCWHYCLREEPYLIRVSVPSVLNCTASFVLNRPTRESRPASPCRLMTM